MPEVRTKQKHIQDLCKFFSGMSLLSSHRKRFFVSMQDMQTRSMAISLRQIISFLSSWTMQLNKISSTRTSNPPTIIFIQKSSKIKAKSKAIYKGCWSIWHRNWHKHNTKSCLWTVPPARAKNQRLPKTARINT